MGERRFTKEHYINVCSAVLDSHSRLDNELEKLLLKAKRMNPVLIQTLNLMYEVKNNVYVLKSFDKITKFYQQLASLIPNEENLYAKQEITSLKQKNDGIEVKGEFRIKQINYVIEILCFLEEVSLSSLTNQNVSFRNNLLFAHLENIDFFIKKDEKTDVTLIRIIIPCELIIEYCVSAKPIK